MAAKKTTKRPATKSTKPSPGKGRASKVFTAEEREAMRARAREMRAASRGDSLADAEAEVLAKLASMPASDRAMGERLHAIVTANAPGLTPRLWYGMPAYARDGEVVCFFQAAQKFKTRYSSLGFSDKAALDDGALWPVAFAVKELTAAAEERIATLVKRAAG